MSAGTDFCLTLFTNEPALARQADQAGVNRIGVDLERVGKEGRQGHLNTWISDHTRSDLDRLSRCVSPERLFCRINPIHAGSAEEIDAIIDAGASTLMLPMFTTVAEVERLIRLVDERAHPVLLLETAAAAAAVKDICAVSGVSEIHIGMNDLRLSLGWPTHFEVLVSDLLARMADTIQSAGITFCVGGLGRARDESLPIASDLVYAQYPRLGASGALISRAFFNVTSIDLTHEIRALRQRLDHFYLMPSESLTDYRLALQQTLGAV